MLRTALASLFCSLVLIGQSFAQEIFVPRQLKAVAVNPPASKEPVAEAKAPKTTPPKEVVRRAEPVTEADLKVAEKPAATTAEATKAKSPKTDPAPAKTEKAPAKEKAPATVKGEKAPLAKEEPAASATKPAKTETAKAEPAKEKEKTEKVAAVKEKEKPAPPAAAKTQPAKPEPVTVKAEKAAPVKEEPATKTVVKTETAKPEPVKEKTEKPAVVKEKPASDAAAKTASVKIEAPTAKTEKPAPAKDEPASKSAAAKTDSVKVETVTAKTEKQPAKDKPATVAAAKTQKEEKAPPAKEEKPAPAKEESATKAVAKTETAKTEKAAAKVEKPEAAKDKAAKTDSAVAKTEKTTSAKEEAPKKVAKSDAVKAEPSTDKIDKAPAKALAKTGPAKPEASTAKVETPRPPAEGPITVAKTTNIKAEPVSVLTQKDPVQIMPAVSGTLETGLTRIADGFDFPVGKPDAENYYKARGFRPGGHVGEDWDGVGGGDTDLKDPIYSIGDGIVVFARDVRRGWGNVIIVRHAYREGGMVKYIDALYGHLHTMTVGRGQKVARGQLIGTMGTAHGQYDAHLHFEIRKNLEIGMSRSKFQKSFSNYYDPTQFINSHRRLSGGGGNYKVAMNTFTHDWAYKFDSGRSFSPRKRSTSESSAALKQALTSR